MYALWHIAQTQDMPTLFGPDMDQLPGRNKNKYSFELQMLS